MAVAIKLPRMSDTMEEGTIVSWFVKLGDTVKSSEMIADVETDKATMELENFEKGEVLYLLEEGATVPVETVIAVIGKKGEDFQDLLKAAPAAAEEAPAAEVKDSASVPVAAPSAPATTAPVAPAASTSSNGRVFASPLAKSMAEEKGIDLSLVAGSGDNGRIIKKDIENYVPSAASTAAVGVESFEDVPVSQMRKTIAKRLAESKFSAPHFYLTKEIKMDAVLAARKRMNEYTESRISINDIIVKAAAVALKSHPNINSSWLGDRIRRNHHVHIGVAVAIDDGLLVPVVRFADSKSLSQIGAEVRDLAGKAKTKELKPQDWEGNTFTISNLGAFGIDEFTAIVNPPDACILAIGSSKETIIVENGEMRPGHVMKVTLSCDHRAVDGVTGANFLKTFAELLEEPVRLLV